MAHFKYERPDGSEALIFVDATTSEQHRASAMVTEHAVESGTNVTDHVRPDNDRVVLRFVISNTPIRSADGEAVTPEPVSLLVSSPPSRGGPDRQEETRALVVQWPEPFDRIRQVHGELEGIRTGGVLLSIITSLKTYEDMAIRSLNITRSVSSGSALEFELEAVQLRVVSSATVVPRRSEPRPSQTRARAKKARGAHETTKAKPEETQRASVAHRLFTRAGLL